MSPSNHVPRYQVYILRMWQESENSPLACVPGTWRFSLESPATGQRRGFSCLLDMTVYLENLTKPALESHLPDPENNLELDARNKKEQT
jgi:hypothetical protein